MYVLCSVIQMTLYDTKSREKQSPERSESEDNQIIKMEISFTWLPDERDLYIYIFINQALHTVLCVYPSLVSNERWIRSIDWW